MSKKNNIPLYKKKNIKRLFECFPTIYGLLRDADDILTARNYLMGFVSETIRQLSRESLRLETLEFTLQNQCLNTFRKMLSARSERLAKYSVLKVLWNLANEKFDDLPEGLNDGFLEEITHLFKGMQGRSGMYIHEEFPEFVKLEGREASIARSRQLDKMAERCISTMKKYPSGLDSDIKEIREKNRRRILKILGGTDSDWHNSAWQIRHVIKSAQKLESMIHLSPMEKAGIEKATAGHLPFGITPYYVSLMDRESHRRRDHAVRAQVIPPLDYVEWMLTHKDDQAHSFDFMMEHQTTPVDLITRRYPSIVILKPYNACSQVCVYCQRNWEIDDVHSRTALASKDKLKEAFKWLRRHKTITEVLVTGGDPLIISASRIDYILSQLSQMDHIEGIRIGTRIPVVLPMRITESLLDMIARYHKPGVRRISCITHFEHPYEVTPEAMEAVQKFKKRGISVYNQAVFTIENSRRFELCALRRLLRIIGVEPYYTFNTKGKQETRAYRAPMARLRQEIKEEARLLSGLLRTDEPVYNVPGLGKNYIRALQHHSLLSILPDGRRIYEFHPWEKNLQLAETFIDTDVSIYDYLNELRRRGEDPKEYRTIWYYY